MSQAQVKVVPVPSLRVHAPHPTLGQGENGELDRSTAWKGGDRSLECHGFAQPRWGVSTPCPVCGLSYRQGKG